MKNRVIGQIGFKRDELAAVQALISKFLGDVPNMVINKVSDIPIVLKNWIEDQAEKAKNTPAELKELLGDECITEINIELNEFQEPILRFGQIRVAVFNDFTDGKNLLTWGRANNPEDQLVENNNNDGYGAVAFNNASLKFKIGDMFDSEVQKIEVVNTIAFENTEIEDVFMPGFLVYISSEDLQKGVKDGKSFIQKIEDAKKDAANNTAKRNATLTQLPKVIQQDEDSDVVIITDGKCPDCGSNLLGMNCPNCWQTTEFIRRDN